MACVCHRLAACQRHTPSSLVAAVVAYPMGGDYREDGGKRPPPPKFCLGMLGAARLPCCAGGLARDNLHARCEAASRVLSRSVVRPSSLSVESVDSGQTINM